MFLLDLATKANSVCNDRLAELEFCARVQESTRAKALANSTESLVRLS